MPPIRANQYTHARPRLEFVGEPVSAGHEDPLISALIEKLPPVGTEWPAEERKAWLELMDQAFTLAYGAARGRSMDKKEKPQRASVPAAGKSPRRGKAATPKPKPDYQFVIDRDGVVRDAAGERVLPGDVNDVIRDLRGENGDLGTIEWADGTRGVPRGLQIEIAA